MKFVDVLRESALTLSRRQRIRLAWDPNLQRAMQAEMPAAMLQICRCGINSATNPLGELSEEATRQPARRPGLNGPQPGKGSARPTRPRLTALDRQSASQVRTQARIGA